MFHNVWPFIGSLGRLVEVPFTASESVSRADRYVEALTVEGARRVQVLPASPRSWAVDVRGATPNEVSGIASFANGAWGAGPWHWVPVLAQRGNLLTPREADLVEWTARAALSAGGPVRDADGVWAARSLLHSLASGWTSIFTGLPVIAGMPVTWACDVTGTSPQVTMTFHDVAGAVLAEVTGTGAGSGMQRVSVTAIPPAGSVSARVGVRAGVSRVARPQVSWTDQAVPWSRGHGCRSAVVDGLSENLLAANSSGTYSDAQFSIMEVS